ncbi:hypothetical protein CAter282_2854 [Collimonas arenae]|uniref:Uncharacterized protein n=1 Tax=Collimonas arenae TaxID=279058 RepID=A0A127QKJ6_9BURK|nr:hypothetical protein CAter10_3146 [Collimonas arenae]AMP10578.1 hypothetical protein CAter282_2854 [Collimonas arenae]
MRMLFLVLIGDLTNFDLCVVFSRVARKATQKKTAPLWDAVSWAAVAVTPATFHLCAAI